MRGKTKGRSRELAKIRRYNCKPPPCRTLADMTKREIRKLEFELGAKVSVRAEA